MNWISIEKKLIGMPSPARLGIIRVIVVTAVLAYVLWEDFPSFAEAELSWFRPVGFIMFVPETLLKPLLQSSALLLSYKLALVVSLLLALVGLRTRVFLVLSAGLFFFYMGIVRSYAWFFHTGLIPFFLMLAMAFLPSGEAVSIDQKRRRKESQIGAHSLTIGWSVFLLRAIVAFSYFQAGFAKLRNSGFAWLEPWNLKRHVVRDTLDTMQFQFQFGLDLMHWPETFWFASACVAVFSELFYPIVLFSWRLRFIYPIIGIVLHLGILFLHNIFFPDLILIQLIFYDWDRIFGIGQDPSFNRRKPLWRDNYA